MLYTSSRVTIFLRTEIYKNTPEILLPTLYLLSHDQGYGHEDFSSVVSYYVIFRHPFLDAIRCKTHADFRKVKVRKKVHHRIKEIWHVFGDHTASCKRPNSVPGLWEFTATETLAAPVWAHATYSHAEVHGWPAKMNTKAS